MRILELVLQGVAGSLALSRYKIGAGTTGLRSSSDTLPIGRLLSYALFDESVEPPSDLRAPGAEVSRMAATLQDHGGRVYRVVRDLMSGAVQLSAYESSSRTFSPVSSQAAEVNQYLRGHARLVAEDIFRDLLWLHGDRLPSRWVEEEADSPAKKPVRIMPVMGGAAAAARYESEALSGRREAAKLARQQDSPLALSSSREASGSGPAALDTYAHLSLEDRRQKVLELEGQKKALDQADELQFALDGKQRSLFEIEEQLAKEAALEKEMKKLESALDQYACLEDLGDDIDAKLEEYDLLSSRHDAALRRIEQEMQRVDEKLSFAPRAPLANRLALAGLGATGLFTIGGLLLEPIRWLLFLNPVALGVFGFALLEWIGELEKHDKLDGKRKSIRGRSAHASQEFAKKTSDVHSAMERLGVESTQALRDRLKSRKRASEEYASAKDRLEKWRVSAEHDSLKRACDETRREISKLEESLRDVEVAGVSPMDLMRDIEALMSSIERAERPSSATIGASSEEGPHPSGSSHAPSHPDARPLGAAGLCPSGSTREDPLMPDPASELLSRLGDALLSPPSELGERMKARVTQFASVLTQGRYTSISFHGRAGGFLIISKRGEELGWEQLEANDRDLVYLSTRLAFMEAVLQRGPQPVVLEAPFDRAIDRAIWPSLAKIVRHLGSLSPVLHYTSEEFFLEHADRTMG